MKKYNLVIKESVKFIGGEDFPTLTTGNGISGEYKMLTKKGHLVIGRPFSFMLNLEKNKNKEMTTFAQQEIDNLPQGFVKLFDIIEVKEELYYIKFPYCHERFMNVDDEYPDSFTLDDKEQLPDFKTMFTEKEIDDKYPLFKPFAVKVEEIDNV